MSEQQSQLSGRRGEEWATREQNNPIHRETAMCVRSVRRGGRNSAGTVPLRPRCRGCLTQRVWGWISFHFIITSSLDHKISSHVLSVVSFYLSKHAVLCGISAISTLHFETLKPSARTEASCGIKGPAWTTYRDQLGKKWCRSHISMYLVIIHPYFIHPGVFYHRLGCVCVCAGLHQNSSWVEGA